MFSCICFNGLSAFQSGDNFTAFSNADELLKIRDLYLLDLGGSSTALGWLTVNFSRIRVRQH
jgi:hypothetical protein